MSANPALHPHNPEAFPDTAPASPSGEAMPEFGVKSPLESVPCSPDFDRSEKRTYGGVEAGFLAWAAPELLRRKWDVGIGAIHHALWKFTSKVQNALFTYSRVKRAMRWLHKPQAVSVFIDDRPKPRRERAEHIEPDPRPRFKWAVSPKETYQWEACVTRYGFDPRGTSVDWIERQVREARAKARSQAVREFKTREGLKVPIRPKQAVVDHNDIKTKTFEPAPAQFGEIWPPVPVPDMAEAPVTVTADYASEAKTALKADPDEAVIGVVYIVDETTRKDFRNDGTWWRLAGQYARTEQGLVYKPP